MAEQFIRSEIKPPLGVDSQLYRSNTVPGYGTVWIINQSTVPDLISVALVSNGNVISSQSYIASNVAIMYGQIMYLQQIAVGLGDEISVKSMNGTSNFVWNARSEV